jgi:flavin reductase (DIM6/NTAB) family NADH-FMN oxidoreductase RutF
MYFDPADGMRPPPFKFSPFKSLVVPRPIGWISSLSAGGIVNLAPYSFFNAVAEDPPCVVYSASGSHAEGGPKDSLRNVEETGEFVFNLATYELREQMNQTSANVARDVDEMEMAGLAAAPSIKVGPPRVRDAAANLECRYLQTVEIPNRKGQGRNAIVFGEVVGIHIRDDVIVDGMIDVRAMRPIARLGYNDYAVVDDFFTLLRPD